MYLVVISFVPKIRCSKKVRPSYMLVLDFCLGSKKGYKA